MEAVILLLLIGDSLHFIIIDFDPLLSLRSARHRAAAPLFKPPNGKLWPCCDQRPRWNTSRSQNTTSTRCSASVDSNKKNSLLNLMSRRWPLDPHHRSIELTKSRRYHISLRHSSPHRRWSLRPSQRHEDATIISSSYERLAGQDILTPGTCSHLLLSSDRRSKRNNSRFLELNPRS